MGDSINNQKCCVQTFENKRVRKTPENLKHTKKVCQIYFRQHSPRLFLLIFYVKKMYRLYHDYIPKLPPEFQKANSTYLADEFLEPKERGEINWL